MKVTFDPDNDLLGEATMHLTDFPVAGSYHDAFYTNVPNFTMRLAY